MATKKERLAGSLQNGSDFFKPPAPKKTTPPKAAEPPAIEGDADLNAAIEKYRAAHGGKLPSLDAYDVKAKEKKSAHLHIVITPTLKKQITEKAKHNNLSVGEYIAQVLAADVYTD